MRIKPYQAPEYTQVRNAVIDYVMPRVSPSAWKVLMVIIRRTWGFHREEARISVSFLERATGLSGKTIKRAVAELLEGDHITRDPHTAKTGYRYSLNVEYEIEIEGSKLPGSKIQGGQKYPLEGSELPPRGVESTPKKETLKETKKEREDIWKQILSLHLGDPIGIRNAYAGTELAEIADGYLLIYYPNAKSMEWSRRRLRHLEEAVAAVLPGERQIRMEVRDERGD